jgi:ATP-dependent DNA helicase DinG
VIETYGSLVFTKQRIPEDIKQLTGIKQADLVDAPTLEVVMTNLSRLLDGAVLVAHNASFDVGFLQRSLQQCGLERFRGRVLDSVEIARICFPTLPSLNLGMLSKHFGIAHDRPHQADSDALATAEVLLRCLHRIRSWPLLVVQRIDEVMNGYNNADIAWFFKQMRNEREAAVALDTQSYRYYRRFSLGVQNWGDRSNEETPSTDTVHEWSDVAFANFYETLKEKLRSKFANYEERPAQDEMIAAVYETLEHEQHLLVEAGTGTGKSLAYLIASLFYAIANEQKMVVSTHTINLMDQLVSRDVPLLQELWPGSFEAAIVKGRNHYMCLRKFEHTMNGNEFPLTHDMYITAAQMLVWLNETQTGDDEELQFWQKGKDFWKLVESDSQSCLNRACPWYKKCFYHRSRYEAGRADLIITNHSLVFADMQTDNKLLPAYEHLVIDEAHHFESAASKHFGIELTYPGFLNTLLRLYRDQRTGQLAMFRNRLRTFSEPEMTSLATLVEQMMEFCITVKENWEQLGEVMFLVLQQLGGQNDGEQEQYLLRLKPGHAPAGWDKLQLLASNLCLTCTDIFKHFDKLTNGLRDTDYETEFQGSLTDLGGALQQLLRLRDSVEFFFALNNADHVYWLEAGSKNHVKSLHYFATPIDVSGLLRDTFFDQKQSVIMTSATLAVDRSFEHVMEQLGLKKAMESGKLLTKHLTSPFQYEQQALVCIPNNFPDVRGNTGDNEFVAALVASITDVARVTGGRMLILFTSNRMLKQVHAKLQPACARQGIHVLSQNVTTTSRTKLTRMFREQDRCVLLGTSSFWEGVDIPGDALTCLVIVRLPFQPPTHPLFEAKSEHLKKQNKNSFMQLAVPQAVIRFKQGFGRLIRTTGDKGVVILYDGRVINTRYGAHFLRSLPSPRIEQMPTEQMPSRIGAWLQESREK